MHAQDWITLLGTVAGILTVGAGAVAKLTRLVTAVEGLAKTLEGIVQTVTQHERRLGELERDPYPTSRRRPPW